MDITALQKMAHLLRGDVLVEKGSGILPYECVLMVIMNKSR
jgi:hypothetical protein